jgi:hypothetical protein
VSSFTTVIIMLILLQAVEAELPQEYLLRVGYLQAFGYGMLPGGEQDEVEIPTGNGSASRATMVSVTHAAL